MRIKVQFTEQEGLLTGFTVSGHDTAEGDADFSVLCAAVSSAVQLTCNTLTEYFGVPERAVQVHASAGADNRIALRMQNVSRTQSDILRGLYLHFTQLSESEPGRLVLSVQQTGKNH